MLFAYPYRSKELNGYRKFIVGQFAAFGDSNLHFHVVNLDCAIRLRVTQSNDASFTSYDQFKDLITHHVIIRGSPSTSRLPTAAGTKRFRPNTSNSDEVCKRWNLRRCTSESCKYRHACTTCGQHHEAKSCGG